MHVVLAVLVHVMKDYSGQHVITNCKAERFRSDHITPTLILLFRTVNPALGMIALGITIKYLAPLSKTLGNRSTSSNMASSSQAG